MINHYYFTSQLRAAPGNEELRLYYADWLAEQAGVVNQAMATFIHLDLQHHQFQHDSHERETLQRTAWQLPNRWKAIIMHGELMGRQLGCSDCPTNWTQLQPTKNRKERQCPSCKIRTRYCATIREAQDRLATGPVVIDHGDPRREDYPRLLEYQVDVLEIPLLQYEAWFG